MLQIAKIHSPFHDLSSLLLSLLHSSDKRVAAGVNLASSGLAGAVALAMCYPLDMARTRLGSSDLNYGVAI